ncbi:AsmA-like protein [Oceanihabitans sediminis]|uniref:AsmA family protein n=1 Tax=Oceanihabitans sediminis TaxID=1812012 RepID=A0A368P660_9FLAO|nr:AsmA-like C-terminal region-containing protein [Oceanihabitans sediminis]RBP34326.1 AsmA-like protein [Oceanihabitans sediminis]RCU58008.1 AsmA family protein [Oceanihabitans sediminis]
MKKALKIIGITLLILVAVLLAIPFMFQSQIKDMVKRFINENVNANVEFSDVNLSLLSSFPQAHVSVDDLVITNFEPFKDETFATAKSITFEMSVKELFKKVDEGPIVINTINLNEALLTLKTNKFGDVNYDIVKEKEGQNENTSTEEASFTIDVKDYAINNSAFTYLDEESNITFYITELNHSGNGTFSGDISQLDTKSEAKVSLSLEDTEYLSNNIIKLDALIDLDLENSKYSFKENKGYINQLPLEFQGYIKMLDDGQEMDISFENPGSDFKDFLAVIPKEYSKNIENVATTGNFKVKGNIKGVNNDTTIPHLDINISSNNASFKYPDLPKRVENIAINASVKNDDGNIDNTYLNIKTLNFKIDQDVFKSSATIKNITKNMLVNADIDGVLNLANITKAYPVSIDKELSGILKAKLNTAFDMQAIETNAYKRIKNNGSVSITDFIFSSEDIVNPIHISKADVTFHPGIVSLDSFDARTGKSDLNATGNINNLLGFLLSDGKLKGNFNVKSNTFAISDFMVADTEVAAKNKTTSEEESLKIPAFLDCTIQVDAKTVLYDNLTLKNVKGVLRIKDEQADLDNMTSNIFDGDIAISGLVNTKNKTPLFNMNLGIKNFDISQSFTGLELLESLAPISKILQGKLNTTINLSGDLDEEFSPKLSSISGNALAELLTTEISSASAPLLSKLDNALNFIDFSKLDLKDLKTKLDFKDGKVNVEPFDIKYKDIKITVDGSHGFDKSMAYNAVLEVPAKYLGSEINRLIGKINDPAVENITIPVTAIIGGTFMTPSVKTDLKTGITNLTKQLIEIEKQKLLNQGSEQLGNIIGDVLGGTKPKTDSTKTQENNPIKDVLGGIMGGNNNNTNNTPKDSTKTTPTKPTIEEGVKDVLGGIFGGKKKKETVKDTVK